MSLSGTNGTRHLMFHCTGKPNDELIAGSPDIDIGYVLDACYILAAWVIVNDKGTYASHRPVLFEPR